RALHAGAALLAGVAGRERRHADRLRRRARVRVALGVDARAEVAGLAAALAGDVGAVVVDAGAGLGAARGAALAGAARDHVTRILAARLALADADRRRDAARLNVGSAEHLAVRVLDRLRRAVAADRVRVRHAALPEVRARVGVGGVRALLA